MGPGDDFEKTLESGGTHSYRLDLTAGQFLHLRADQQGADIVLRLFDPSGSAMTEADTFTPAGDDEHEDLYAEITATGPHRLEVSTYEDPGIDTSGDYSLRIAELRPLRPGDRDRIETEALYLRSVVEILNGELEAAHDTLVQAAAGFRRLGDRERWADSVAERCRVLHLLERGRSSIENCEPMVDEYRRQRRPGREARIAQILGHCHMDLKQPRRAIELYRHALAIRQEIGGEHDLARSHHWLGRAYHEAEALYEALLHYGQALPVWRRLGETEELFQMLFRIGQVHRSLGRAGDARRCLEEALDLAGDDPDRRADVLVDLGLALDEIGLENEALARLQEALALQETAGFAAEQAMTMSAIGRVHGAHGQPRQAVAWYLKALPLAPQRAERRLLPDILHNLAWDLHELGASETALPLFARALSGYRDLAERRAQARTLLGIARIERARERPDLALQPVRIALDLLAELRRDLVRPDLRIDYMAGRQDPYDFAIDLLMDLHHDRPKEGWDVRALELVEKARARGLLDLVPTLPVDQSVPIDPELTEREKELTDAVNGAAFTLSDLVAKHAETKEIAAAETRLTERLDALRGLRAEIERVRSGPRAGYEGEVVTAEELQEGLIGADTVLLVYKLGEQRSFLWAATKDDLATFELPSRTTLETSARHAHELLRAPPRRKTHADLRRTLGELGQTLLDPAAAHIAHRRRLLIVPEGALLYLPFAALPTPGGREPVAFQHEVVVLPSASVLDALRRRRGPLPRGTLAVIADPVFTAADRRVAGGRIKEPTSSLPRLLHSRREAVAILSMSPADERVAALDFDAQRAAVLSGLISEKRYVHIATHVQIDPRRPELSRLVLTGVAPDGRPVEGADVLAHEIFRLDLAADLVTLSACDTALGREVRGEGLVGLAHGFFHAGAGGLLLTLWPVDDEATAEPMIRFYGHLLGRDLPAASALRAAQLEIASQPRWADPYHWAGFILVGEGTPRLSPGSGAEPSRATSSTRNAAIARGE